MKFILFVTVSTLALAASSVEAKQMFSDTTPGAASFTAMTAGRYQIDAYGAQGASQYMTGLGSTYGGYGLGVGNIFNLTAGEVLSLRVGAAGSGFAGGGASFVQGKGLLLIGGGGGGAGVYGAGGDATMIAGDGAGGRGGEAYSNTYGKAAGGGGGGGFKSAGSAGGDYLGIAGGAGGGAFPELGGGSGGQPGQYNGGAGGGGGYTGGQGGSAGYGAAGGLGGGSIGGTALGYQGGDGFVTIDQLTTVPGVPEPTTWSLMLGGASLMGWALRRRRFTRTA